MVVTSYGCESDDERDKHIDDPESVLPDASFWMDYRTLRDFLFSSGMSHRNTSTRAIIRMHDP
jgi:hypothetical protein